MEAIVTKLLGQYGIVPTVALMIVVLWFFLREVKKEVGGVKVSVDSLKDDLLSRIEVLEKKSDAQDAKISRELEELKKDMRYVEREYVRREDHYKDLGGWRAGYQEIGMQVGAIHDRIDTIWERISGWKN